MHKTLIFIIIADFGQVTSNSFKLFEIHFLLLQEYFMEMFDPLQCSDVNYLLNNQHKQSLHGHHILQKKRIFSIFIMVHAMGGIDLI